MGRQPTEIYALGLDDPAEQAVIAQQRLRPNMLGLCIKNLLTTDTKRNFRAFRSAYNLNYQDDGAEMFLGNSTRKLENLI